jgi:hypothetical protein
VAQLDESAVSVLRNIRELGKKTAIVSNTPWGSAALFVGDDPQWDVFGARAGIAPVLLSATPSSSECSRITQLAELLPVISKNPSQ